MDTTALEDLGLTGAEVKVFMALLELGPSQAGPIVEKSGLQNAVVHRALHSLGEKGFVTYVLEGKKKIYQTINPKQIVDFIDDKKKKFESILPELVLRQNTAKKRPEATIFRGVRGIKELLNFMLEDSKEYFAYGGSHEQQVGIGDYFWRQFHAKRISKRISARIIFQPSLKYWGKELGKKKITEVKYTKTETEPLQETVICRDKVAIIIYTEKPYGILIEDSIASRSYKSYFEMLWKSAKK